jgi:hypothetical protein
MRWLMLKDWEYEFEAQHLKLIIKLLVCEDFFLVDAEFGIFLRFPGPGPFSNASNIRCQPSSFLIILLRFSAPSAQRRHLREYSLSCWKIDISAFSTPPFLTDIETGLYFSTRHQLISGYGVGNKCRTIIISGNRGFFILFCSCGNVSAVLSLPNKH